MIRHGARFAPIVVVFAGLLLLTGCTGFAPPSINLTNVRMVERSDEAAAFHFDLMLENPNSEPIELREIHYELTLDGTRMFQGRRAAFTTLHPLAVDELSLPAVVRYDLLGADAPSLPESVNYQLTGTLHYQTPGELAEILLDTGVRRPKVRFVVSGRLELTSSP